MTAVMRGNAPALLFVIQERAGRELAGGLAGVDVFSDGFFAGRHMIVFLGCRCRNDAAEKKGGMMPDGRPGRNFFCINAIRKPLLFHGDMIK